MTQKLEESTGEETGEGRGGEERKGEERNDNNGRHKMKSCGEMGASVRLRAVETHGTYCLTVVRQQGEPSRAPDTR
jgi:hypothetical protein